MIHACPALASDAANLEGCVVEQQIGYRLDVTGVQGGNEAVEKLPGRCSMHAPHARDFLQPRTPAVERGLDRTHCRGENFRDLFESEIEHLFQNKRGPCLWRDLAHQNRRRLKSLDRPLASQGIVGR
jgi:hypothetical protein